MHLEMKITQRAPVKETPAEVSDGVGALLAKRSCRKPRYLCSVFPQILFVCFVLVSICQILSPFYVSL